MNIDDACDNCPATSNLSQDDTDIDGIGDVCDYCPSDPDNDVDSDSVCGDIDNCPNIQNANQSDFDKDGIGDACDDDFKINPDCDFFVIPNHNGGVIICL